MCVCACENESAPSATQEKLMSNNNVGSQRAHHEKRCKPTYNSYPRKRKNKFNFIECHDFGRAWHLKIYFQKKKPSEREGTTKFLSKNLFGWKKKKQIKLFGLKRKWKIVKQTCRDAHHIRTQYWLLSTHYDYAIHIAVARLFCSAWCELRKVDTNATEGERDRKCKRKRERKPKEMPC